MSLNRAPVQIENSERDSPLAFQPSNLMTTPRNNGDDYVIHHEVDPSFHIFAMELEKAEICFRI